MATKPAQICQLQKGKMVDTQKGFVDTFNWAVQSIANLKGGENCEVTWPTDDHPTIDCTAQEGEGGDSGGGGGGGGGQPGLPGPFEVTLSSEGAATFTNCVLRIARAYFFFQDQTLQGVDGTDQIIYVRAEHTDPPTISVGCGDYATVSQNLGGAWSNCLSTTITPLYRTLSGQVKCDYRYMMNIQAYDARNYSNSI